MRHTLLLITVIGVMLAATFVPSAAQPTVQDCTENWPFILNNKLYIPLLTVNHGAGFEPGGQLLKNGPFESGWTDINGSIQQANFWTISWVSPGQPLYDESSIMALADPEFTHKCNWQLPFHEQPGQPGALILDGITVYKIFHGAPFGGELRQTVSGLPPGLSVQLTVPILLADDNGTDPYGHASGVWINGIGDWAWKLQMGNRNWYMHTLTTTVPGNGLVDILIRVKSKWGGADFFIDAIRLEVLAP